MSKYRFFKPVTFIFLFCLYLAAASVQFTGVVYAKSRTSMVLEYDGKQVHYDSEEITLVINDQIIPAAELNMPPLLIGDRTYVTVSDVFTKMGATVEWKKETSEVHIFFKNNHLILQQNNYAVNKNGTMITYELAPKNVNNRIMVPLAFVSELMGFLADWDGINKVVYIKEDPALQTNINVGSEGYILNEGGDAQGNANIPIATENNVVTSNSENASTGNAPTANTSTTNVSSGNQLLAKDVSQSLITPMSYPGTVVTGLVLPGEGVANEYRIQTTSEISQVNKFLLEDNRLIIDIHNAEMGLPKTFYNIEGNTYLKSIRAAQNQITPEMITRLVFDFTAAINYSVSLSQDRKTVVIRLESNTISNVSFTSDGFYDYISIQGVYPPVVDIYKQTNPSNMIIDIPLSVLGNDPGAKQTLTGKYTTGMSIEQADKSTVRITLDVVDRTEHQLEFKNNMTIIKLTEPTYKNLFYDTSKHGITISKATGLQLDINAIGHTDNYNNLKYSLNLKQDYSAYLGYGKYVVGDGYIDSFEVKTENGMTQIVFNESQILAYNIYEDANNYYIDAVNPKQKYSKIVVLDPGHGARYPGTSGNGLIEKEVNLDIALRVLNLLEQDGRVKAYATRLGDYVFDTENITNDLVLRATMANNIGDMFVSIHHNASATSNVPNGIEVFYSRKNNAVIGGLNSQKLAEIVQNSMVKTVGLFDRKYQDADDFVVLKTSKVPAILIECAFLTNPVEAAKVKTEEHKQKTATAIFNAIIQSFELYKPVR